MARKYKTIVSSGQTILLVDDNQEYLEATRLVLEREGYKLMVAKNGEEALQILKNNLIDLVLLDYFMPGMTGEEVVADIRQFNTTIQVILQTGYESENPPRDLLRRLDIQGYHEKSDGTEKLLLWVEVGLKAAYRVQLLNKSKRALNYILEITPEMHKIQPLEDLFQAILWQFSGLLGFGNSFLAVKPGNPGTRAGDPGTRTDSTGTRAGNPGTRTDSSGMRAGNPGTNDADPVPPNTHEGFLAMLKEDMVLRIHAGIGRFSDKVILEEVLSKEEIEIIDLVIEKGKVLYYENLTIIPLQVGDIIIGIIYLDEPITIEADLELLHIFANQAAVAIQNSQLYEMATRDQLTGVYVRRYIIQLLQKEIRSALYSKQPITILLLDLDNLKRINDSIGHSAGDRALALLGKVLQKATRTIDYVGRYGGDEFLIILPQTTQEGALQVVERIIDLLHQEKIYGHEGITQLSASIGISALNPAEDLKIELPHPIPHLYFIAMVQTLIRKADEQLYHAKEKGRDGYRYARPLVWLSLDEAMIEYERTRHLSNL